MSDEAVNFSIVLRVKDIQKCKSFYRNELALGSPLLDTPFWVEFQLCGDGKLCLESVSDPLQPVNGNVPVWMLETDPEIIDHLTAAGCKTDHQPSVQITGYNVTAFHDPEGNLFYLKCNDQE
jgi:catechol 2,3-dioxygenase-like lactoylglutathione lyase family enzyme